MEPAALTRCPSTLCLRNPRLAQLDSRSWSIRVTRMTVSHHQSVKPFQTLLILLRIIAIRNAVKLRSRVGALL